MKIYNEETMYYGYWIGSNLWKERSEDKTRVLLEFPRTMEETELQKQNYNPKKVSGGAWRELGYNRRIIIHILEHRLQNPEIDNWRGQNNEHSLEASKGIWAVWAQAIRSAETQDYQGQAS